MTLRTLTAFLLVAAAVAWAQGNNPSAAPAAKRPLSESDFDGWRTIATPTASRDGRWIAYSYMPLEGDGDLMVHEVPKGRSYRIPVGALPPPPLTASESDPERPAPRRAVAVMFTADCRFLVASTFPSQEETLQAKRAKKKPRELPKEGLVVVNLETGQATRIADVKNAQIPAQGGARIAFLRFPPTKTGSPEAPETQPAESPESTPAKDHGSDLVLRDLTAPSGSKDRVFPHVSEYSLSRDGTLLLYLVASPDKTKNGVYAVAGTSATPLAIAHGPGKYAKLAWDRTQTQAVFTVDRGRGSRHPSVTLCRWARGASSAEEILLPSNPLLPAGYGVSAETAASFSFDGRKVFVPTAPLPRERDPRLASLLDEERVPLELWRWDDDFVPPVRRNRADRERRRTYLGILDLQTRTYRQIADPTLAEVTFSDDGMSAYGLDDRPYRRRLDYDGVFQDLYLIDTTTGERRLATKELGEKPGLRWSPNGRWFAYFLNQHWYSVDRRDGSVTCLTSSLPHPLFNELSDEPEAKPAYGSAGWTRDGDSFLVYDRFDVWQVFPDGRTPRNITAGYGRASQIQLRVVALEPIEAGDDKRGIDPSQPLFLRGESMETRATGFFRTEFGSDKAPQQLLWAARNYQYVGRAQNADLLLVTAQRFDEYPDVYATTPAFDRLERVSYGGAQLEPFLWGSAELLSYRSADGVQLPAVLYRPANFDPRKKYPMIVYMYERLSYVLNVFTPPAPNAVVNTSFYTSNGYLVLTPDIAYTTGYPGRSALRCVVPAVDEIVRRGYVDENAIGLEGHSWGGYEAIYLITQTNRFRAAEAGAVVSNMTSAYSGIRLASGRIRQFQYEKQQSRIGQSLYSAPHLYLENSPVFFAASVETPVLILHNDHDDAVPWSQAVEFFMALRRLGKEAYLCNYNDEFHSPRRRADQKDFAKRMHQFFDHFLKGAPKPDWMVRGIPLEDRDEELLRFRENP
ncbi:hypothetical protein DB347_02175 [Opitutaceae bacterium EW11]|nr:hypothetical protein DB347_02175 [Opitutaceae bacterium EW11]